MASVISVGISPFVVPGHDQQLAATLDRRARTASVWKLERYWLLQTAASCSLITVVKRVRHGLNRDTRPDIA